MIAIRRVDGAREFCGILQASCRGSIELESMRRDLIVDPFFGVRDAREVDGLFSFAPEDFPSPGRGIQLDGISLVLVSIF